MKIDDINYFYDEICFKALNEFELSSVEKEFFKCYGYLIYWYNQLQLEKKEKLKKIFYNIGGFNNEK